MESTYCTIAEVTTYAAANGEAVWLELVQTGLTGAVNLAAGYTAGSKSMAVDGFGDNVNRITSGAKFTIATDSTATEHTIISTRYDLQTVFIDFRPGLAESVADNDVITVTASEASLLQTRCVVQAAKDVIRYHKQMWADSALWLDTNDDLQKANIIQAIHLARVLPMRDTAANIGEITGGSYNDGALSIEGAASPSLHPDARFLIDKVLSEYRDVLQLPRGVYAGR